jgi:hypothetical protein
VKCDVYCPIFTCLDALVRKIRCHLNAQYLFEFFSFFFRSSLRSHKEHNVIFRLLSRRASRKWDKFAFRKIFMLNNKLHSRRYMCVRIYMSAEANFESIHSNSIPHIYIYIYTYLYIHVHFYTK